MRRLGFILLSLLVGLLVGSGIKYTYEANTFRPYEWDSPPILMNCYGKDFSKLQMVRAIDYWTLRGFSIGFYEHDPPEGVCENEWLEEFILIKKDKRLREPALASTKRYTSLNKMKAAVIYYRPGSFNLYLINEHELGHALGFSHVEEVGHIMHPILQKMGQKFYVP